MKEAAELSRRDVLKTGARVAMGAVATAVGPLPVLGQGGSAALVSKRPAAGDRRFRSEAVEQFLMETRRRIGDAELGWLFENCFPNTLDTTVEPGTFEGKPDTVVITGDIPAMWLRDSSAQVWPYLPLAAKDARLRALLEGVIRRQTRCLLIDTYANAFMADLNAKPLEWSLKDKTETRQGVGERKYELDSICYPIRLAHGYWKATGNSAPFDSAWTLAMRTRAGDDAGAAEERHGAGAVSIPAGWRRIRRTTLVNGLGNPVKPGGLIASCFRPSDDACMLCRSRCLRTCLRSTSLRQLGGDCGS